MSEAFVPLAAFLRPVAGEPVRETFPEGCELASLAPEQEDALRATRRFRAALADALDVAVPHLLRAIALDVLRRELQLRPADIAAIARDALQRLSGEEPIAIRAHPDDLSDLAAVEFKRISDISLSRGDIVIEVRSGTIDVRLEARLDDALAVWRA